MRGGSKTSAGYIILGIVMPKRFKGFFEAVCTRQPVPEGRISKQEQTRRYRVIDYSFRESIVSGGGHSIRVILQIIAGESFLVRRSPGAKRFKNVIMQTHTFTPRHVSKRRKHILWILDCLERLNPDISNLLDDRASEAARNRTQQPRYR